MTEKDDGKTVTVTEGQNLVVKLQSNPTTGYKWKVVSTDRTFGYPADERFLSFLHPTRWRYDVLRALDYFRSAAAATGAAPDPRLAEAVEHVRARGLDDGRWPLDWRLPGRVWFHVDDGPGEPSRWVTLRAMRVLRWWDAARPAG